MYGVTLEPESRWFLVRKNYSTHFDIAVIMINIFPVIFNIILN